MRGGKEMDTESEGLMQSDPIILLLRRLGYRLVVHPQ